MKWKTSTKELFENPDRLEKIVDYIIDNHQTKTHNKMFTGMFAVSSVDTLTKYYELFKAKDHKLKIATIFSYSANEENLNADGEITFDDEIAMQNSKTQTQQEKSWMSLLKITMTCLELSFRPKTASLFITIIMTLQSVLKTRILIFYWL